MEAERAALRERIARIGSDCAARLRGPASEPGDVPLLARAASSLCALESSLGALVQLCQLVREAEVSLGEAAQSGGGEAELSSGRLALLRAAADAFCAAAAEASHACAVEAPERLRATATRRLRAGAEALRLRLAAELRAALQEADWPPPLPPASGGGASPAAAGWRLPPRAAAAAALLDSVCAAHRDTTPCAAERDAPPAPGWAVTELCAPLCERLRLHFAAGLPTDRPEKPEWLLAHALRMAAFYAPLAAALPAARGCAPQSAALASLLAGAAAEALRARAIPWLLSADGPADAPAAWLHLADEATRFDAALAPLAGEARARGCGAARLLAEHPEWAAAELRAATQQLDAAMEAEGAWDDAEAGGAEEDVGPAGPRAARPACALRALALVQQAAARAEPLPLAEQRRAFLRATAAQLAADFLGRVARRARGASAFGDPAAPDSLRRFAQCVAAARLLEAGLELLAEAPQLAEAAAGEGGALSPLLAQCAARQGEWLQAVAEALSCQFEMAATPRLRAARFSPLLAITAERRALAAALAGLGSMLEPALLARVWCVLLRLVLCQRVFSAACRRRLVAAKAKAFLAEELVQSHGADPHAAVQSARELLAVVWAGLRGEGAQWVL